MQRFPISLKRKAPVHMDLQMASDSAACPFCRTEGNLIANIFFAQVPCGAVATSYISRSAISIVCFQTPCLSPLQRGKKALPLMNLLIALLALCESLS